MKIADKMLIGSTILLFSLIATLLKYVTNISSNLIELGTLIVFMPVAIGYLSISKELRQFISYKYKKEFLFLSAAVLITALAHVCYWDDAVAALINSSLKFVGLGAMGKSLYTLYTKRAICFSEIKNGDIVRSHMGNGDNFVGRIYLDDDDSFVVFEKNGKRHDYSVDKLSKFTRIK